MSQKSSCTETPNIIFELMPHLSGAQFKIVMLICRKTYGCQQDAARIGYTEFMDTTGLARPSVNDAVAWLMDKGIIRRTEISNSFEYSFCPDGAYALVNNGSKSEPVLADKTVQEMNRSENLTTNSSEIEPNQEQSGSKSEPVLVQKVNQKSGFGGIKGGSSKIIPSNDLTTSAEADAVQAPDGGTGTEHQQMFEKICDIVGWDWRILDERSKGQVAQTLGYLRKNRYTLVDLNGFGTKIWANDWRWKNHKQRPTLTQLRQEIGKLRANGFHANGDGNSTWDAAFAAQDIPDYIRDMQQGSSK